jgi:hypothetical protein
VLCLDGSLSGSLGHASLVHRLEHSGGGDANLLSATGNLDVKLALVSPALRTSLEEDGVVIMTNTDDAVLVQEEDIHKGKDGVADSDLLMRLLIGALKDVKSGIVSSKGEAVSRGRPTRASNVRIDV